MEGGEAFMGLWLVEFADGFLQLTDLLIFAFDGSFECFILRFCCSFVLAKLMFQFLDSIFECFFVISYWFNLLFNIKLLLQKQFFELQVNDKLLPKILLQVTDLLLIVILQLPFMQEQINFFIKLAVGVFQLLDDCDELLIFSLFSSQLSFQFIVLFFIILNCLILLAFHFIALMSIFMILLWRGMFKYERLWVQLYPLLDAPAFWRYFSPAGGGDQILQFMNGRLHADQLHVLDAFHLLDGRVQLGMRGLAIFGLFHSLFLPWSELH